MDLKWKIALALVALLFISSSAFGWHIHTVYRGFVASTSSGEPTYSQKIRESFGAQITENLKSKDVRFAIISRSGQKRSKLPDGVMFTHSAFWLVNDNGGYDVWNLYHGEDNRLISSLVTDTPADFLRLTQEADVGILIPKLGAQDALIKYLNSPDYGAVHQINYSLISNPFDSRYQNCNEFMLDTLAAFFWDTKISAEIKTRLQGQLKPTQLKTSWIRRYIGPKVDERLIMADHDGAIFTTTRQTLGQFLDSENALAEDYILPLTVNN